MASASNPLADEEATGPTPTTQPWEGGVNADGSDMPGSGGQIPWQRGVYDTLVPALESAARANGMYPGVMEGWLSRNYSTLLTYLQRNYINEGRSGVEGPAGRPNPGAGSGRGGVDSFWTGTPEGLNALVNIGLGWVSSKIPGFDPMAGRAGGGGSGRPSAADIRAQFDISQLATDANHITQGYLLQEHEDPRAVARAYVEAIVRNPEQKLDFQTFVVDHLKSNPRWATLYKHKPGAINELQYIGQYTSAAQNLLGANRGEDWSGEQFHAMALGADPNAWQERLERSNSFTSQAPFVAKLEARAAGLSHILKDT